MNEGSNHPKRVGITQGDCRQVMGVYLSCLLGLSFVWLFVIFWFVMFDCFELFCFVLLVFVWFCLRLFLFVGLCLLVCSFVCLSVYLSVCLFVWSFVCFFFLVCLFVCLFVAVLLLAMPTKLWSLDRKRMWTHILVPALLKLLTKLFSYVVSQHYHLT